MPSLSNSRLDQAGRSLRLNGLRSTGAVGEINAVLDADDFRAEHWDPLLVVHRKLFELVVDVERSEAGGVGYKLDVGYRLKQLESIVAKLQRQTVRLSQMEDIGGCRVVTTRLSNLGEIADLIRADFEVVSDDNYVANPKRSTGYRSHHLVVMQDGFKVEIQLRTDLQNEWADLVEGFSLPANADIKHGEGPASVIKFFKKLSGFYSVCDSSVVDSERKASQQETQKAFMTALPELEKLSPDKETFELVRSKLGFD